MAFWEKLILEVFTGFILMPLWLPLILRFLIRVLEFTNPKAKQKIQQNENNLKSMIENFSKIRNITFSKQADSNLFGIWPSNTLQFPSPTCYSVYL